jgi:hypothetical protein
MLKMIQAVLIGLTYGSVGGLCLLLATTSEEGGYTSTPTLLYFGVLTVGVFIVSLPRSRKATVVLTASLLPAVLIALQAQTCEFSTDVLKPCVEVYSTQQNLTYSITYLIMGLLIGVGLKMWRKQRPQQPQLHRVG